MVIMTEKIPLEICELYNTVLEKIERCKPDKQKKADQKKVTALIRKIELNKFPYIEDMVTAMYAFTKDDVTPDKDELKRLRTKKRALEQLYPELKE